MFPFKIAADGQPLLVIHPGWQKKQMLRRQRQLQIQQQHQQQQQQQQQRLLQQVPTLQMQPHPLLHRQQQMRQLRGQQQQQQRLSQQQQQQQRLFQQQCLQCPLPPCPPLSYQQFHHHHPQFPLQQQQPQSRKRSSADVNAAPPRRIPHPGTFLKPPSICGGNGGIHTMWGSGRRKGGAYRVGMKSFLCDILILQSSHNPIGAFLEAILTQISACWSW